MALLVNIPNTPEVINQIEQSYNVEGVGWQSLLAPSITILRHNSTFAQFRNAAIEGSYTDIYTRLNTNKTDPLFTNQLLLNCLTNTVITLEHEEQLFTLLRKACLQLASSRQYNIDYELMVFMLALACQCFSNEYAFSETEDELAQLEVLTTSLKNIDTNEALSRTDQVIITLLSMYQPLYTITQLKKIILGKNTHQSAQWDILIERQYTQPLEELRIKENIETLTHIEDQTSQAVQEQYEDSPYPRWLSINLHKPRNYQQILSELFPSFKVPVFSESPLNVLIAGCGTGSHAAMTGTRFANINVLAIDLSRQSLAYAQRMANRNQLNNLRFAHADILALKDLKQRFQIIESMGVLHHMKEPEKGLKVLTDLLDRDGLINLGFYSTIARRQITRARERYTNTEPTPANLRQSRQEIFALAEDDPLRTITKIKDFYSLSECRDLIFHTQEHCYTIAEIKELIHSCGLKFIGFELPTPAVKKQYMENYPDDTQMDNLDNWGEFEENNQDTFLGMYTFWCQRDTRLYAQV